LDLDQLRDGWWSELRESEQTQYEADGRDFDTDEVSYRCGFEAAQHKQRRGKAYSECEAGLRQDYSDEELNEAFRRGFDRGVDYHVTTSEIRKE
jgi:hypothetical protein